MITNRLYYDNAYLTVFDANVVSCEKGRIALDASAFYPTSGGQPFDTGKLTWENGEAIVTDVNVENGIVWHTTSCEIPIGTIIHGEIDWARRFDHMQQHAGDHMIAGTIWQLFQGVTIGLHTSQEVSTIDIAMPDGRTHLTDAETAQVERIVNARIHQNAPIRCWFPEAEELNALPLRKKPTVSDHVRIVAMGDFEMVACGGTHPRSTGEIGLVKILSTAPSRGNMRLTFVAGMRALHAFQAASICARDVGALLSADVLTAPAALQKLMDNQTAVQKDLQARLVAAAVQLIKSAVTDLEGVSVALCHLPFADASILQQAAKSCLQNEKTILLLSCPKDQGLMLLFARSQDLSHDMASLLRNAGARGGGKPDFAQGSTQIMDILEKSFALL